MKTKRKNSHTGSRVSVPSSSTSGDNPVADTRNSVNDNANSVEIDTELERTHNNRHRPGRKYHSSLVGTVAAAVALDSSADLQPLQGPKDKHDRLRPPSLPSKKQSAPPTHVARKRTKTTDNDDDVNGELEKRLEL